MSDRSAYPNTISLIGMPGAGKSTVGVILAKLTGLRFVDTDIEIQQAQSATLQELLEQAGYDMLECFVTSPMVPLTLEQARKTLGNRVVLWGCLPSLLFAPSFPEDEFRAYVHHAFDVLAPGDAVILGVADNVMPDSVIERVAYVQQVVEERGTYPIR